MRQRPTRWGVPVGRPGTRWSVAALVAVAAVGLPASAAGAAAASAGPAAAAGALVAAAPSAAAGAPASVALLAAAGAPASVALLAAAGSPASVAPLAAAGSPFDRDEAGNSAPSAADRPSTARLDRAAAALRRSPLVVDPELQWTLSAPQQRALVRRLRAARIAVFVAVLPNVDEDESGGDTERTLQTLQRRVGRDGLYVVVDQDGRMDLASVGVPLDLGISYSLLSPRFDRRSIDEQVRDPAPAGYTSISERLGKILDTVAKAGPGEPNAVIDDVDPLEPLAGTTASDADREDAIAAAITGTILGLLVAGLVLGIAAGARSARGDGGPGGPQRAGAVDAGRSGRGVGGPRRLRGRRRGKRRG